MVLHAELLSTTLKTCNRWSANPLGSGKNHTVLDMFVFKV